MSATVAEFRQELEAWLAENYGPLTPESFDEDTRLALHMRMYDAGFVGVTWPVEYGGRGLSADFQTVFNEVTSPYSWAMVNQSVTVGICAATLLDYASEEQKKRHIPRMLRGDETWTQLLSEPGAGSDLGGVSTRAERDGDEWVINGQKVWTSGAVQSDYAIALLRTDPDVPKYQGVSMIIVELKAPGVDIRPLREMTGEALFNEVFLDDVRMPVENLVGELNDGWAVLSRMLFHERMALSAGTVGGLMVKDAFADLVALARRRGVTERSDIRAALGEVYMQHKLMEYMGVRMREAAEAGKPMGPVGSIGKIGIARAARLVGETGVLIAGNAGQAWEPGDSESADIATTLLFFPMTGIAGGTTEIQKNVVAERVLGLPREARPDRDLPFRELKTNAAS